MKYQLSLLLILLAFGKNTAQNFNAADGAITWQKVYESDLSQDQIRDLLSKDAQLAAIAPNFSGRTEGVALNCDGSMPLYMEGLLTYFVTMDFKDGRYRVSISDLQLIPSQTISLYGVESSTAPVALEDYQLRRSDGEFRKNAMAKRIMECMDQYLAGKFEFKELTEHAEAW